MSQPYTRDVLYESFLHQQVEEGLALAAQSDLLDLEPLGESPQRRFLAYFRCTGLVRTDDLSVREADQFVVGIALPSDYLRREPDFWEVLTWLDPLGVHHPNIAPPRMCVGRICVGTPLLDLLYRCYALICYQSFTTSELDALNWDACQWARRHRSRFPIDRRPLKWMRPPLENADVAQGG